MLPAVSSGCEVLIWRRRNLVISPHNRHGLPKVLLHACNRTRGRSAGLLALIRGLHPWELALFLNARSTAFNQHGFPVGYLPRCRHLALKWKFFSRQLRSSCTVNAFSDPSSDGSDDVIKHASRVPSSCLLLGRCCNTSVQLLYIEHILWLLPFRLHMNIPFWRVGIWGQAPFDLSGNPGGLAWPPPWEVETEGLLSLYQSDE